MTLIVVFSTIAFFIIGYFVMSRVDIFINNKVQPLSNINVESLSNNDKKKYILIFGYNKITELIIDYCETQGYSHKVITEIDNIDRDCRYTSLLALSNSDADNLIISSIGYKVYSIPYIITLCNHRENLKIYNEFNFNKVLRQEDEIEKIYKILKEMVESAVKVQG